MKNTQKPTGRKNHYIPEFYLKQWARTEDGRLCEICQRYKGIEPRWTHPGGTGYMPGLYTFPELSPSIREFLEDQFFLQADDRAYAVLSRLLADDVQFDGPTRSAWSRFVMSLFHRTPEGVARITKKIVDEFPAEIEKIRSSYSSIRDPSDPDTFDEFRSKLGSAEHQEVILRVLQSVMDSELVGTALNNMIWGVIRIVRSPVTLLTSDRPLVISNGFARDDAHIVMPISPDRVFVAAKTQATIDQIDATGKRGKLVTMFNDFMARTARKYVWATDASQLRFIQNRLGEKRKWSAWE